MTRIVHGCESPFLGGFTELRYHGFRQMCRQKGRNEDEAKQKEALVDHQIPKDATVCDLGSGQGLTSVFLVKEYGFKVIAADLWSDPEENRKFFRTMGLTDEQIVPVKADAEALPFEKEFFDAVVSTDSYNYGAAV